MDGGNISARGFHPVPAVPTPPCLRTSPKRFISSESDHDWREKYRSMLNGRVTARRNYRRISTDGAFFDDVNVRGSPRFRFGQDGAQSSIMAAR